MPVDKYSRGVETIPKGSVVVRDLRLWHAGIANPGTDPRIMLAFVHTPSWYMCPGRIVLPEAARELVEVGERGNIVLLFMMPFGCQTKLITRL